MTVAPSMPTDAMVLAAMIAGGVACTVYAALAWHLRVRAAARASGWPVTDGEILSAEIVVHRSDDGDEYEPQVRYAYRVAGHRLTGDRLRVGTRRIRSERAIARAAIAHYRAGDRVRVHYDPARPERSVLEPAPTGSGLRPWLLCGLFLLASSAYVAVTLLFPDGL